MSMNLLPPERLVACACDPAFARAILVLTIDLHLAAGCLRCGAVSVMARLADEPHPHVTRLLGNREVPLAGATRDWLAAWPRVAGSPWLPPTGCFLPASVRAEAPAALEELERAAVAAQADLAWAERLRRSAPPTAPLPPDLPPDLARPFGACARGLALTGGEPLEELLAALGQPWLKELALPLVQARPSAATEIAAWLRDAAPERRDLGRRAAAALRPADPTVLAALVGRLADPATASHELHGIAYTLEALGATDAAPLLRAQAARIRQQEYYTAKYLDEVATRLGRP